MRGIRESASTNNVMVLLKISAILIFIIAGAHFVHPAHWHPFYPNGWSGVLTGGSIIFFTYIGFDSVSTAAEECREPQRDVAYRHPWNPDRLHAALCGSCRRAHRAGPLAELCWTTQRRSSMRSKDSRTPPAPSAWNGSGWWCCCGAMIGMISSILVFQLGQARIWFAMSRDRLFPAWFGKVHPRFRTPAVATWIAGIVVAIPSGLLDIGTLADLSNIGTLFAFLLVSIGVIVLRIREPERRRGFRAPGGLLVPVLSILFCGLLMGGLPVITWLRFFGWLFIGLGIYFLYSRKHSEFYPQNGTNRAA